MSVFGNWNDRFSRRLRSNIAAGLACSITKTQKGTNPLRTNPQTKGVQRSPPKKIQPQNGVPPMTFAPSVIPGRAFVFTNAKTEDCNQRKQLDPESRHAWSTSGHGTRLYGILRENCSKKCLTVQNK